MVTYSCKGVHSNGSDRREILFLETERLASGVQTSEPSTLAMNDEEGVLCGRGEGVSLNWRDSERNKRYHGVCYSCLERCCV